MNAGCIEEEVLSAYADGQSQARERVEVESHLEVCARCRARLEELRALKAAVASAWSAAPAMPEDLRRTLLDLPARTRARPALFRRLLRRVYSPGRGPASWGLRGLRPAFAFSFSAAGLALALWFLRADAPWAAREELPVAMLLEAHGRYAATLPLAGESAAADLPELLADDAAPGDADAR